MRRHARLVGQHRLARVQRIDRNGGPIGRHAGQHHEIDLGIIQDLAHLSPRRLGAPGGIEVEERTVVGGVGDVASPGLEQPVDQLEDVQVLDADDGERRHGSDRPAPATRA